MGIYKWKRDIFDLFRIWNILFNILILLFGYSDVIFCNRIFLYIFRELFWDFLIFFNEYYLIFKFCVDVK